jgi:hypothetical protein
MLAQISRECTPSYLFTGLSNLLQPAQAEAVLGQRSTYLASWDEILGALPGLYREWRWSVVCKGRSAHSIPNCTQQQSANSKEDTVRKKIDRLRKIRSVTYKNTRIYRKNIIFLCNQICHICSPIKYPQEHFSFQIAVVATCITAWITWNNQKPNLKIIRGYSNRFVVNDIGQSLVSEPPISDWGGRNLTFFRIWD